MSSFVHRPLALLPLAAIAAIAIGCGGPPKVRSVENGQRLPADGATATAPSALPQKTLTRETWTKTLGERLRPSCDGKEGSRTADAQNLQGAGKIIGNWTAFSNSKGKSRTADGKKVGGGVEPTRVVNSVGMTCGGPNGSTVQVNGVMYPFDYAWVVSGQGKGPTLDGDDKGAGYFAMIQAVSFKDKRVVFAKVYVPSDANDDTDDTVIISSLAGYIPDNADEPVVRSVSEREDPKFETFIPVKGGNEGISFQVPQQDALGRARYLSVARYNVSP